MYPRYNIWYLMIVPEVWNGCGILTFNNKITTEIEKEMVTVVVATPNIY